MAQCVFCEQTQNLNTQLTITLEDGQKVVVQICESHSEEATVKSARIAYNDKQKKIDDVLAQARALGLNIGSIQQHGSILVAQAPPQQQPQHHPQQLLNEVAPEILKGDNVVSTDILDTRRGMVSVGGSTSHGSVASYSSIDTSSLEKLPPEARRGKARLVSVEARTGLQIVIPETRVDGTGTTHVKIVKKEDDVKLQARFKRMASNSINNNQTPNFAREGYQNSQTHCPICRGECSIKQMVEGVVKLVTCPKCDGLGSISLI